MKIMYIMGNQLKYRVEVIYSVQTTSVIQFLNRWSQIFDSSYMTILNRAHCFQCVSYDLFPFDLYVA